MSIAIKENGAGKDTEIDPFLSSFFQMVLLTLFTFQTDRYFSCYPIHLDRPGFVMQNCCWYCLNHAIQMRTAY